MIARRPPGLLRARTHLARTAFALGAALLASLLGVAAWWVDGSGGSVRTSVASAASGRVRVEATVEKVNAAANSLDLRVWALPEGDLADDADSSPSEDLTVTLSGLTDADLRFPAHRRISAQMVTVELAAGDVTAYPFDRYATRVYVAAAAGGEPVPVGVALDGSDPLFRLGGTTAGTDHDVQLDLTLHRTRGSTAMALLMVAVMWALALAVAAAAWVIIRRRSGLVWPAMGWMAATLFALAAFRNTAPGGPPMGCLLDYAAFLWAEAIVAASLVAVVWRGVAIELAQTSKPVPPDPTPPASGAEPPATPIPPHTPSPRSTPPEPRPLL